MPGLEVLISEGLLQKKRIGLITNHTGVNHELRQNIHLLLEKGYKITALFSPEHGLYGDHADGEAVDGHRDKATGIPVFSLYGATQKPQEEHLQNVDVLVFDIQDIGARYYTYLSTMILSMEQAAAFHIPFVVLDRPNPIGGVDVEGNVTQDDWISFVAGAKVAIRHGMTLGEIARMVAKEKNLPEPQVIKAVGWKREMYFQETGFPWVPTSPNAPSMEMAILYPGMCLIEGTNLSEGRGTSTPFQVVGAPWVDGDRLAEAVRKMNLPGILVRPVFFRPSFSNWAGNVVSGIQIHIINQKEVRPCELGVRILFAIRDLFPDKFALRPPGPSGKRFIDLLAGGQDLGKALEGASSPEELLHSWRKQSEEFKEARKEFLLY